MPELPEVETIVRALRPLLAGRLISGVRSRWPQQVVTPSWAEFGQRLPGNRIVGLQRRGKYLVFQLSGPDWLIIHLKMSGHLSLEAASAPEHRHLRTVFVLDGGQELRFRDMRKFGRIYLVGQPDQVLGRLGPEPLDPSFTVAVLQERLGGRSRALKPLLLDQGVLAGVGNIYADEALHHAGIHPTRPANSLSAAEAAALHAGIQAVLRLGIAREGASIDLYRQPDGRKGDMQNAVAVFRRTGQPCPRCGQAVERIVLGGRSTHFCPGCQH